MPKISVTGTTGGRPQNPIFGTTNDRADSNWMNQDVNAREREQKRREREEARLTQERQRMQERAMRDFISMANEDRKLLRLQAEHENATYDSRSRNTRRLAEHENQDYEIRQRTLRKEAEYIQQNMRLAQRVREQREARAHSEMQAEATWMRQDFDAKVRFRRKVQQEREREARQQFNDDYALAMRENADRDRIAGRGGAGGRIVSRLASTGGFGSMAGIAAAEGGPVIAGVLAAAALVKLAATAPQTLASIEGSALGGAMPAMNLMRGTYGMARDIGSSPLGLYRSLFPGNYGVPSWLSAIGLGPTEAFGMLNEFGITPGGNADAIETMRALGSAQFMPGLSGLNTTGYMSTLGRYGALPGKRANTAGGIDEAASALGNVMENAIVRGMNRTDVLQSIDTAIHNMARVGAGDVSAPGIADFLMRFSGLPGGRTGEFGVQALGNMSASLDLVGQDPIRTMIFSQASMQRLGSRGALRSFMEGTQKGSFDNLVSNAPGQAVVNNYLAARSRGDYFGASLYLREIVRGNPQATYDLYSQSPFLQGSPGYMKNFIIGQLTGLGTMGAAAYSTGQGTASDMPISLQGGAAMGASAFGSAANTMSQVSRDNTTGSLPLSREQAREGLHRMGVNPAIIENVLDSAQRHGLNPLAYGAYLMTESSGGNDRRLSPVPGQPGVYGAYGQTGIQNPAQISASSHMPMPTSPQMSVEEGAQLIEQNMRSSSTVDEILHKTVGPQYNRAYLAHWQQYFAAGGGTGTIAPEFTSTPASAGQGIMGGSAASLEEMNLLLPRFNNTINGVISGLNDFNNALKRTTGTLTSPAAFATHHAGH
jgi:hypothetical protein